MEFEIIFSRKALKQLKKLDKQVQIRIKDAIEKNLRVFPPRGDITKLETKENRFRLRVGDWRVSFRFRFEKREVHISKVEHRSKAYRD